MAAGSGFLSLFLVLSSIAAQAQDGLPRFVVQLIEDRAAEGLSSEALVEYYEEMLRHPLNLNDATRTDLEACGLLTRFQVESVLSWRERYGAVRSASELSLVEGFNAETVSELRPFFTFGEPSVRIPPSNTFTFRGKNKWGKKGISLTAKDFFETENFSAGVVLDNDPLERFPDFVSVTGRYKGLYAGDFTARFGQGLVLWKSFSLSAFGDPSAAVRTASGLQSYRSTDESNFFRGLGWTHSFGQIQVTALASYNALDANVQDGAYTSIVTTGLHATEAERAKRHAMHEYVLGANATIRLSRWRFGLTAAAYRYDKANGRRVQDYNRYQQYDGWWGNLGVDWYGTMGSLRLFGEAALDAHGAPAVLAGALWSPSYNFESSLTTRCYAPAYIATHAGAHSTLSSVSNQLGVTWAAKVVKGPWTALANLEYVYYPWKRYRTEAGTHQAKMRLQVSREWAGGAVLTGQAAYGDRWKGRLQATLPLGRDWTASVRMDANLKGGTEGRTGGVAGYADIRWKPSRRWEISARVTAWRTDGWDARIYLYERGVPQSFALEPCYGKGIGEYLVVKYSPIPQVECWVKVQQGYAAYFVRIFIPG